MIRSLHHTGLTVADLDRSLAFYCGALGLEVVMRQEQEGGYLAAITGYAGAHVRMAHLVAPDGGHRLELFQYLRPAGRAVAPEPRDVGVTHVCLVVEDVHEAYARVRDAGGSPVSEPVRVDAGANAGAWALYVRDPDGITIELFEPARA